MASFSVIVTALGAIVAILACILGAIVKIAVKWTKVSVSVEGIQETVTRITSELVKAVARDNDFETRIQLLERDRIRGV